MGNFGKLANIWTKTTPPTIVLYRNTEIHNTCGNLTFEALKLHRAKFALEGPDTELFAVLLIRL